MNDLLENVSNEELETLDNLFNINNDVFIETSVDKIGGIL